ncbi:hypothetical protein OIU79_018557 [Salix purpurea]|uniref:Uncharacterized protein n=1 Tax=Salix purpurea TaxID=77065 RepID=A0A9Q0WXL9_SALPP|nr:hypothetical protein OIU79_018557 [Salix purpurea]
MDFSLFWCFLSQLTGTGIHVYRYLEPLCNDHRKLRQKITDGRIMTMIDYDGDYDREHGHGRERDRDRDRLRDERDYGL